MATITKEELAFQTESLVKSVGLNTPMQVGIIVIMYDHESHQMSARAVKMEPSTQREILRQLLDGYGKQITTTGVTDARGS